MKGKKILHRITLEVTEEFLRGCSREWGAYTSINLSPQQMLELFQEDENLLIRSLQLGFDTGERESFSDLVSQKLLQLNWPLYCETNCPEYKDFDQRIKEAAKKAGYQVM